MKRILIALMSMISISSLSADDWSAIPCPEALGAHNAALGDGWYVDAAVLWWKTGGDELDYGLVRYEYDSGSTISYKQRYHDMKMSTNIGFQIGAGMPIPCYDWTLDAEWTHFINHTTSRRNDSADPNANQTIFAIPYLSGSEIYESSGSTAVASVQGHYRVRYDVVDIECGKWLGRKCSLFGFRPHAGVRMANIRESLNGNLSTNTGQDFAYQAKVTNDFIGIGVKAGFDASVAIYQGLSLIGKASGSIVWGRTKIDLKAKGIPPANSEDSTLKAKAKEDYLQGRAMADLALGLNYVTEVCDFPIDVELDWELRYLFGQHRFYTNNAFAGFGPQFPTLENKKNGDLTLQGLTLKFAFDF
jgi:hypothetical protein